MSHTWTGYYMRQFIALLCGVVCCFGLSEAKAEWLDPNWAYRVPITIGSTANLSDYPVKLLVDAMSGMRSDFGDIRFTQSDGTNPISYWMDCQVDATNAVFWIRVPSVQTTSTVVYMYYGNTNATTTSSGANTFSVFEGFDDKPTGQNPVSGWTEIGTANGDFRWWTILSRV